MIISLPYHSPLYSSILTNLDQEASTIKRDNLESCSICFIFKSSNTITWFSLIYLEDNFCRKSFLWFLIRRCNLATLILCLLRFLPPFFIWDSFLCSIASFNNDLDKCFGLSILSALLSTIYDLIPKSIPTLLFDLGLASIFSSTRIDT